MRKEINIEKVRGAILFLQSSGVTDDAQEIWNLLDWYVSQSTQPLATVGATGSLPRCRVTDYRGGAIPCTTPAIGHLIRRRENSSYPMCREHGESLEFKVDADWVQTFFDDEDE